MLTFSLFENLAQVNDRVGRCVDWSERRRSDEDVFGAIRFVMSSRFVKGRGRRMLFKSRFNAGAL